MNLYAESSAVLAWLLGEDEGRPVRRTLAAADVVLASDLTLVECDRVLIRAVSLHALSGAEAAKRANPAAPGSTVPPREPIFGTRRK